MAAVIKSHVYEIEGGKYVHAVYSDVVDSALTDGIALNTIKAGVENAPAVKELRVLRTTCNPIIHGADAGKFAVRAVLRYVA